MKVSLQRYDDIGTRFVSIWTGSRWQWFRADLVKDEATGKMVTQTTAVAKKDVPERKAAETPEGYLLIARFFNDDGSSPDPRTSCVERRAVIPKHSRQGRIP